MQTVHAAITAVGGYVPEYRLTNQILETMVDTNDEWIKSRTGISERHIQKGVGLATSDMAVEAVKLLLQKTPPTLYARAFSSSIISRISSIEFPCACDERMQTSASLK